MDQVRSQLVYLVILCPFCCIVVCTVITMLQLALGTGQALCHFSGGSTRLYFARSMVMDQVTDELESGNVNRFLTLERVSREQADS